MNYKTNKIRTSIVFATLFFVLFSLQNAHSSSPIKVGAKCKIHKQTIIYQNKQFICVKSNKKLVWSNHLFISTTSQKVDNFVPWSINFNSKSMIQAALKSTDDYFGNVVPSSSYEIIIDQKVNEYDRKWKTKVLDYSNGSFSKIERDKIKVFIGRSHEWSVSTLKNNNLWLGDPSSPIPCSIATRDALCADKNLILMVTLNPPAHWPVGYRAVPAHELFHTVQNALLGYDRTRIPPGHPRSIPRWLFEGSASYYGYYVVEKLGFDSYSNGRDAEIANHYGHETIKSLSNYDDYVSNPYGIGQAATEYIIASVGFESLLNIFKYAGTEGSFALGFKKAVGLDIEDFYIKFDQAIKSMDIN
jgi:hypothetical protein